MFNINDKVSVVSKYAKNSGKMGKVVKIRILPSGVLFYKVRFMDGDKKTHFYFTEALQKVKEPEDQNASRVSDERNEQRPR